MKQINFRNTRQFYLNHRLILLLFFLLIYVSQIKAQEIVLTSGNSISDTGGSVSYSVGQIIQQNATGSNGSIIQGIQFYFDSSTLTVIDMETNLEIATYPNPTTSILNIHVDDFKPNTLSYKLFNTSGKLISNGTVTDNTTRINVDHLQMATYILKINNTLNQKVQTFKIIKN
ncbi:T9SS type A sorting domain-containing protein [Flavivirga aquimarina]|uniref:T9SS type A sorting domain-containing protein n=1 Tax=Flavivirga aquimarina TaxID=2027862 RepID=A0ABT8W942_9FLAO|nr:T9SS type A sorting domain-containing protein [Flavivirga aquimarina]MDO5969649.1 T9SS type A sorting domain-containing protein [Flavivirga aquimarina]